MAAPAAVPHREKQQAGLVKEAGMTTSTKLHTHTSKHKLSKTLWQRGTEPGAAEPDSSAALAQERYDPG